MRQGAGGDGGGGDGGDEGDGGGGGGSGKKLTVLSFEYPIVKYFLGPVLTIVMKSIVLNFTFEYPGAM